MPLTPRLQLSLINNTGKRVRLVRARLEKVLAAALREARITQASLTVLLINDDEAKRLHAEHFSDPTTTDVMTFPDGSHNPATNVLHLGDLAVCVDVAAREAEQRGRGRDEELTLYILHGLLHLLDYDDVTPAQQKEMWAAQVRLLKKVGITIEANAS
jgi:probable rRNA maturation factor